MTFRTEWPGKDVGAVLPAVASRRLGQDAEGQAGRVADVALLAVGRLHVEPGLVLEHRVDDRAQGQSDLRLRAALRLVQRRRERQHHRDVGRMLDRCLCRHSSLIRYYARCIFMIKFFKGIAKLFACKILPQGYIYNHFMSLDHLEKILV